MTDLASFRGQVDALIADAEVSELPDVIGALAAATARAELRLRAPAPAPTLTAGLVTAAELARRFSLSVSTINELSRAGRLPCKMFGRFRRFDVAEVASRLAHNAKSASLGATENP